MMIRRLNRRSPVLGIAAVLDGNYIIGILENRG